MAQPIYKYFQARMTDAWFQLSAEEQKALMGKVEAALAQVGGKSILTCNSLWNSERWWFWGVEEFPSMEAVMEHAQLLENSNWVRYCDSETLLGTTQQ